MKCLLLALTEYNSHSMKQKKFPKIGLALGSGGAKGLAHIGVLKSLERHHIPISYIAGSSIGALIGAHYAKNQDSKKLEDLIMSFNRKKGMELFDFTVRGGIVKGKKTEQFITEILEGAQFHDLKIPFTAVATDLNTAEPVIMTRGSLSKAIRASTSIPAFYQPIIYEDKLLADGGLSNPVPVDIVSAMGADVTIAINLDQVYVDKTITVIPSLSKVPVHAINILRHNLALYTIKAADVIISPRNTLGIGFLGWSYFFDNIKAIQIIKAGEEATDKAIPEIEKQILAYQKRQSPFQKFISFFKSR